MKHKFICQNRACEYVFCRRVKSILDKVRCPHCKWVARPINMEIAVTNPEIWNTPRFRKNRQSGRPRI